MREKLARWRLLGTLVATACSPAADETQVYVDVHGAVEAVRRVRDELGR